MAISAAQVKDLRERTGAGMMECKKALTETDGDIEAAIELMRKSGMAKADKKAGRIAAEGLVVVRASEDGQTAVMVEVNCETDFVTKGDDFQGFVAAVATVALQQKCSSIEALLDAKMADGATVAEATKNLIAKIGENMNVRRVRLFENPAGLVASYLHGTRIAVLVSMTGGSTELARDIAMHIAASRPQAVSSDEVDAELIAKEKEIYTAQAAESGKPADIVEKMVLGRVQKFLKEVTLLGQPFVKDPEQTVEKLLKSHKATVNAFDRFEVGEGIEKKQENFAEEVMSQVKG